MEEPSEFAVGDSVYHLNDDGTLGNAEILMFHRGRAILFYPKREDCYQSAKLDDLRHIP